MTTLIFPIPISYEKHQFEKLFDEVGGLPFTLGGYKYQLHVEI
jgi:hypothetical protein